MISAFLFLLFILIFILSLFHLYFFNILFIDYTSIHLVDRPPSRPNVGRVQVQYDDTVTDVCFEGNDGNDRPWNVYNLQGLCKQLGYPG